MRIPLFLVLIATCAHTLRADASVDDSSAASHGDETISAAGQTAALQQPQPPAVSAASPKTKRGIFHHHAAHHPHGLTYNVPLGTAAYPHYGFQKPWHQISYAKVPLHHHNVHLAATAPSFLAAGPAVVPTASIVHHHHAVPPPPPPAVLTAHAHFVHPAPPPPPPPQQPHHHPHYIVSPGSAAVSSYNVNYPRYPFYGHSRPHIDVPAVVAVRPAPPPAVLVRPAAPLPIGAGASIVPTFANRIPIGRPFPGFAPQSHHHHFVPTASTQTVYTQTGPVGGLYPIAPAVHHNHAAGVQPPHAHFVPALPGGATVASFPATAAVAPTIASGTFDQWHPIYVANSNPATVFPTLQPAPTTSTVSVNANGQPASDLLPPFGSAPAGAGAGSSSVLDEQSAAALFQQQLQQQQYENAVAAAAEYTAEHQQQQQQLQQQQQQQQQYQSQVSQLYGPPSDNQLDAGQEYVQASQQLQQQQQQQRAIIEEQQQIHSAGAFNGQGLEAPSNNGHYAGPSSYEVQLNSYTRAI